MKNYCPKYKNYSRAIVAIAASVLLVFSLYSTGCASGNEAHNNDEGAGHDTTSASVAVSGDAGSSFSGSIVASELSRLAELPNGHEFYSELDHLRRCGVAFAKLGPETIPGTDDKRDRDAESRIHPSGWEQAFYPDLIKASNGALYNRCHLIAWSLAAESANELNLITGTRQLNETMTNYEQKVRKYIDNTGNHVVYRITPDFQGEECVARGVRIEACSIEDNGTGINIDVYIKNAQNGVIIDYATGLSSRDESASTNAAEASDSSASDGSISTPTPTQSAEQSYVLNTNTKKFHFPSCKSVSEIKEKNRQDVMAVRDALIEQGYQPCGNCKP